MWTRALGLAASAVVVGIGVAGAVVLFAPETVAGPDGSPETAAVVWTGALAAALALGLGVAVISARTLFRL